LLIWWYGHPNPVGIDLSFIGLELSQLAATSEKLRKHIARWTRPAIIGTVIGSSASRSLPWSTP
jgi:hypothetical protein